MIKKCVKVLSPKSKQRNDPKRSLKAPKASSEAISRSMKSNKSKGTLPEIQLTKMIWLAGLRGYRKNDKRIPGKPDVYFPKYKIAILLNGCFWHRCPYCKPSLPMTNRDFWMEKFNGNRERDKRQMNLRNKEGIKTLVVWECQLKKKPERVLDFILKAIDTHNKSKA
jgi:DNA mismatch endonuclease (patch repair protein)